MTIQVHEKCGNGTGSAHPSCAVTITCSKKEAKRMALLLASGASCISSESCEPEKDEPNCNWAGRVRDAVLVALVKEVGWSSVEEA